jgi:hypothetical protein
LRRNEDSTSLNASALLQFQMLSSITEAKQNKSDLNNMVPKLDTHRCLSPNANLSSLGSAGRRVEYADEQSRARRRRAGTYTTKRIAMFNACLVFFSMIII